MFLTTIITRSIWKMLGPLSPQRATVARATVVTPGEWQCKIDVHNNNNNDDDNDNDNDNAWQRGPLWPHGMGPTTTDLQRVVVRLGHHSERAVLGVVPASTTPLQVEPQLVAPVQRQLTEQFVAEPVVAARVVEPGFELGPRTIEEVGSVDVLLDQQRNTVFCVKRH